MPARREVPPTGVDREVDGGHERAPRPTRARGKGPASGIPARGAGRGGPARREPLPPFEPGNVLALTSGARSPRVYGALAETLAAGLIDDQPGLAAYPEAVAAWATAEAQVALMRRHLAERGPIDEDGEPRATALHWLNALESRAERARRVLGLDPMAEAVLARERAAAAVLTVDLEGLATRGREVIAAREAAGILVPDLAGDALRSVVEAAPPTTMAERRTWAREGGGNGHQGGFT